MSRNFQIIPGETFDNFLHEVQIAMDNNAKSEFVKEMKNTTNIKGVARDYIYELREEQKNLISEATTSRELVENLQDVVEIDRDKKNLIQQKI